MVIPAQQAKQYAQECAALLRSMERIDLREASYIAADEIDVFHFDALQLIKEAVERSELPAHVVRGVHEHSADVREYLDVTQSRIAVADLMKWLEAWAGECICDVAA